MHVQFNKNLLNDTCFVLLPPQNGVYKGIKKHLVYDWIVKFKNTAQKIKPITMRNLAWIISYLF